jgi:hypothetical protein
MHRHLARLKRKTYACFVFITVTIFSAMRKESLLLSLSELLLVWLPKERIKL